jgi:integrase/recombinase XerD
MLIEKNNTEDSRVTPAIISSKISFTGAVNLFLRDCQYRGLAPTTIKFYKEHLSRIEYFLNQGDLSLESLTSDNLKQMIQQMRDQHLTANYMNGRIRTCQTFFKFLWQDGILETNIAEQFKVMKAHNQMLFTFTEDQVKTILQQPNTTSFTGLRDYVIMLVMLETGMRVMEVSKMKIADIDFAQQTICIHMGKGRKPRIVPVQWTCLNELMTYIRERGAQPFDDLWITISNTPFKQEAIEYMVRKRCKLTEIKGVRGSCHTFRHTMAKFYILNGGDMLSLQYILGHTTLDMTRRYVELFSTDLHQQHEKYSPLEYVIRTNDSKDESEGIF